MDGEKVLKRVAQGNKDVVIGCNEVSALNAIGYDAKTFPEGRWYIVGGLPINSQSGSSNQYLTPKVQWKVVITSIDFCQGSVHVIRRVIDDDTINFTLSSSLTPTCNFLLLSDEKNSPYVISKDLEGVGKIGISIKQSYSSSNFQISPPAYDKDRKKLLFAKREQYNKISLIEWDCIIGTSKMRPVEVKQSDVSLNEYSNSFISSISSFSRFKVFITSYWVVIGVTAETPSDTLLLFHIEKEQWNSEGSGSIEAYVVQIKNIGPTIHLEIADNSVESCVECAFIQTNGFQPDYPLASGELLCAGTVSPEFVGFPASDNYSHEDTNYLRIYHFDPKNPQEIQIISEKVYPLPAGSVCVKRTCDGEYVVISRGTNPSLHMRRNMSYSTPLTSLTAPSISCNQQKWAFPHYAWISGASIISKQNKSFLFVTSSHENGEEILIFDCTQLNTGPKMKCISSESAFNFGLSSVVGTFDLAEVE